MIVFTSGPGARFGPPRSTVDLTPPQDGRRHDDRVEAGHPTGCVRAPRRGRCGAPRGPRDDARRRSGLRRHRGPQRRRWAPCWSWSVLGFGVFVLNTVASVMPGATVLVALVTYALQLVVMAAVVLPLVRSGTARPTPSTDAGSGEASRWPRWPGWSPRSWPRRGRGSPSTTSRRRVRDDPPRLLLSGARWLSRRPRRMHSDEPPHGDPWLAFSYLVSGATIYGLIGWGLDRWLGTNFLVVCRDPARGGAGDLHDFWSVRRACLAAGQAEPRQERE